MSRVHSLNKSVVSDWSVGVYIHVIQSHEDFGRDAVGFLELDGVVLVLRLLFSVPAPGLGIPAADGAGLDMAGIADSAGKAGGGGDQLSVEHAHCVGLGLQAFL